MGRACLRQKLRLRQPRNNKARGARNAPLSPVHQSRNWPCLFAPARRRPVQERASLVFRLAACFVLNAFPGSRFAFETDLVSVAPSRSWSLSLTLANEFWYASFISRVM